MLRDSGARRLAIHDTFILPTQLYAAVSYPWIGVSCDDIKPIGTAIRPLWKGNGLEGDPISVSLLCSVCRIALSEKIEFLWIDRLCIDQVGEYDNEYMWSEGRNVKVLPQGKECVELVLKHLGLSRDTTIRELDHLEPLFVCMTCPVAEKRTWLKDDYSGRVVFGWRKLVGHHYR